jgi:hypothetical protein
VTKSLKELSEDFRHADDSLGRFIHFITRSASFILVALIVISVTAACVLYLKTVRSTEKVLVEQMLHREQVVARAGAKSFENFLTYLGFQLSTYSSRRAIINIESSTQQSLDELVQTWSGTPMVGVALTDANGVTLLNSNSEDVRSIGVDLGDRDYFKELKNDPSPGKIAFGEPTMSALGVSKGQYIVPVAVAVVDGAGRFKGVLASSMLLTEATKLYLDPLKISPETRIYLISSRGRILSAPNPTLSGQNYFEYLEKKNYKYTEELKSKMLDVLTKGGEQKLDVYLPEEPDLTPTRFLIATDVIAYGNGKGWTLAVASPADEAFAFAGPFANYSALTLFFIILVIVAFAAVITVIIRVAERDSYLAGYKDGKFTRKK